MSEWFSAIPAGVADSTKAYGNRAGWAAACAAEIKLRPLQRAHFLGDPAADFVFCLFEIKGTTFAACAVRRSRCSETAGEGRKGNSGGDDAMGCQTAKFDARPCKQDMACSIAISLVSSITMKMAQRNEAAQHLSGDAYKTPPLWVFVLLYGLAHFIAIRLTHLNWGNWGMFWLPSGVGVLMAICYGWRGVAVGTLCSLGLSWSMYFLQNTSFRWEHLFLQGLPVSLTDGLQYALFLLVLKRAWPFRLDKRHNLSRIFSATFMAVAVSVPVLILLPKTLLHLAAPLQFPWPAPATLLAELELLLMSNALGIMLVVPLGLTLMSQRLRLQMREPGTLLLACGILVALSLPRLTMMQEYLVLPFIAWMALRSKLGGAVLGMVATGTGVAFLSHYGLGPFAHIPANQAMTALGAYILSLSLPLLVLGSVLAEWDEQNHRLEDTVRERTQALENANRELTQLARSDPLTNAANRRHFLHETEKALHRAKRYDERVSLGILDLDHFKQINDQYGHACGDQILISIVKRCQAQLRDSDLLGRWGGEEFVVLLPGIAAMDAVQVLEKLRREVSDTLINTEQGSLPVSFTAGVAQWDAEESVEHLLSRADAALYRAKHEGRNLVRLATAPTPSAGPPGPEAETAREADSNPQSLSGMGMQ